MATVIEEQTSTVWKKSNPISFILFTYLHVFSTLSTQGRNGDYGMKILMAQKWSWKSLTYSTFKLKNLSTGSVDMVSYNSLKNFLQLNEKFQNFRRKSHLCILVCFSTTRGKKSGFYYFAIFSSEQKWRTLLGFPSKFQIGKDLLPTLWTFIKRQGRWNSAHWWDVPPPPPIFANPENRRTE